MNYMHVVTETCLFLLFRLTFIIEVKIGGYLILENRENNVDETHNLIGTTKTLQYVFRWDFVRPYHCVERKANPKDCVDPLTVPDLTENVDNCILRISASFL